MFNATNQLNKNIVFKNGGNLQNSAGSNIIVGPITLAGSNNIIAGGTALTLSGAIGGTTTGLNVNGGARLYLTMTSNTYRHPLPSVTQRLLSTPLTVAAAR